MSKTNQVYWAVAGLILVVMVLFHGHQSLMAHAILQGFWYIRTEDDTDYYMLLDDKMIQIIGTQGDVNAVLFQDEADVSFQPGVTMGKFSFSFKTSKDIPVLDISGDQSVSIDIYASCGILDIGAGDFKSRLVKDNSMSIVYAAA